MRGPAALTMSSASSSSAAFDGSEPRLDSSGGVGGVMSAADAKSKIRAGANLVQIYTGLVYSGPGLVPQIAKALRA